MPWGICKGLLLHVFSARQHVLSSQRRRWSLLMPLPTHVFLLSTLYRRVERRAVTICRRWTTSYDPSFMDRSVGSMNQKRCIFHATPEAYSTSTLARHRRIRWKRVGSDGNWRSCRCEEVVSTPLLPSHDDGMQRRPPERCCLDVPR